MVTKCVPILQWGIGNVVDRVVNGLPRVSTLNDVANGLTNPLVSSMQLPSLLFIVIQWKVTTPILREDYLGDQIQVYPTLWLDNYGSGNLRKLKSMVGHHLQLIDVHFKGIMYMHLRKKNYINITLTLTSSYLN